MKTKHHKWIQTVSMLLSCCAVFVAFAATPVAQATFSTSTTPDRSFAANHYFHASREFTEYFNRQMIITREGETPSFFRTLMEGQRYLGSYWTQMQVVDVREKRVDEQTRAKQKAVACSQKNLEVLKELLRLYEKRHQALKRLP